MTGVAKALETGVEMLEEAQLPKRRATREGEAVGVGIEEELATGEYQPNSPRTARGTAEVGVALEEGVPEAEEYQPRANRDAELEGVAEEKAGRLVEYPSLN
jgi:hypothetical protein